MSKAFTEESDAEDDEGDIPLPALPAGGKNYSAQEFQTPWTRPDTAGERSAVA